jgi:hypothetical protein
VTGALHFWMPSIVAQQTPTCPSCRVSGPELGTNAFMRFFVNARTAFVRLATWCSA